MKCTRSTLVPTLAALATVGVAPAIEVGDLSIGGYVDSYFTVTNEDDGNEETETGTDFAGDFVFDFTYSIGDVVSATGEIGAFEGGVELMTAAVNWQVTEKVELMMGHYINSLGWEAARAPGRYRFGASVTTAFYGDSYNQGAGAFISASENLQIDLYIQDYIFDSDNEGTDDGGLAFLADVTFDFKAIECQP